MAVAELPSLLSRFLYCQIHPENGSSWDSQSDIPLEICPEVSGRLSVFHSAHAVFFAPSDPCGVAGMRTEMIRATPCWREGESRYDCVFVETDKDHEGFRGLDVARIFLLFSFTHDDVDYPCALVHWFSKEGDAPDEDTGMWIVRPEFGEEGRPRHAIVHLKSVLRAAHLIPVYGPTYVRKTLHHKDTLDYFNRFYVNKYIDHHANEIAF